MISGVSRVGLSGFPSHKCKGLVKVSASNGVIRVDWEKIMAGGGGSGKPENPLPPDTPLMILILLHCLHHILVYYVCSTTLVFRFKSDNRELDFPSTYLNSALDTDIP